MDVIVVLVVEENPGPDHGKNQVKSFLEIIPGKRFIVHGFGETYDITIVDYPYRNLIAWWVKTTRTIDGKMQFCEASLADMGVIPYDSGSWNQYRWLERV